MGRATDQINTRTFKYLLKPSSDSEGGGNISACPPAISPLYAKTSAAFKYFLSQEMSAINPLLCAIVGLEPDFINPSYISRSAVEEKTQNKSGHSALLEIDKGIGALNRTIGKYNAAAGTQSQSDAVQAARKIKTALTAIGSLYQQHIVPPSAELLPEINNLITGLETLGEIRVDDKCTDVKHTYSTFLECCKNHKNLIENGISLDKQTEAASTPDGVLHALRRAYALLQQPRIDRQNEIETIFHQYGFPQPGENEQIRTNDVLNDANLPIGDLIKFFRLAAYLREVASGRLESLNSRNTTFVEQSEAERLQALRSAVESCNNRPDACKLLIDYSGSSRTCNAARDGKKFFRKIDGNNKYCIPLSGGVRFFLDMVVPVFEDDKQEIKQAKLGVRRAAAEKIHGPEKLDQDKKPYVDDDFTVNAEPNFDGITFLAKARPARSGRGG